jgi:hypothetical protein
MGNITSLSAVPCRAVTLLQATVASFLQYNGTQQGYLIDIDAGDRPHLLVKNAGERAIAGSGPWGLLHDAHLQNGRGRICGARAGTRGVLLGGLAGLTAVACHCEALSCKRHPGPAGQVH